jgi:hypothetical protein
MHPRKTGSATVGGPVTTRQRRPSIKGLGAVAAVFLALGGIPLPCSAGEVVIGIASVVDGDTLELHGNASGFLESTPRRAGSSVKKPQASSTDAVSAPPSRSPIGSTRRLSAARARPGIATTDWSRSATSETRTSTPGWSRRVWRWRSESTARSMSRRRMPRERQDGGCGREAACEVP